MEHYKEVLRKYAKFDGRSSRAEFWYFTLFSIIFSIAASILDHVLGFGGTNSWGPISSLYSLVLLIPTLAVGFRRLHDIGKSGWWMLISLIPLIGVIWLVILQSTKGVPGVNQYGSSPIENTPASTS